MVRFRGERLDQGVGEDLHSRSAGEEVISLISLSGEVMEVMGT